MASSLKKITTWAESIYKQINKLTYGAQTYDGGSSKTPKKVAIIIGNDAYQHMKPLQSCAENAKKIDQTLKNFGFQTKIFFNQKTDKMRLAIDAFFEDDVEDNDIVFFYYSGYAGCQKKFGTMDNYLFGVDSKKLDSSEEPDIFTGIPFIRRILFCSFYKNCKYVVFFDVCRVDSGWTLAPFDLPLNKKIDVLSSYQTGSYADGKKLSLLANAIEASFNAEKKFSWDQILGIIFQLIVKENNYQQIPQIFSNLNQDFYLELKSLQRESQGVLLKDDIELSTGQVYSRQVEKLNLGEFIKDRELDTSTLDTSTLVTESTEGPSGIGKTTLTKKIDSSPINFNIDWSINFNIDLERDLNPPLTAARLIGRGSFTNVYKSTYQGVPVAIKHFHLQHQTPMDKLSDFFQHELSIISQLDHKNIVKLYGACLKPDNRALVLEYVESNLYKFMEIMRNKNAKEKTNRQFSLVNIFKIIKAIASALAYMHSKHIVHRNLNPSNVLISKDGYVKVSDFGISKIMQYSDNEKDDNPGGIYRYLAPEIFHGQVHYESDIYSLGIIAFELWSLDEVWEGLRDGLICHKISNGERPPIPNDMPLNLRELITSCWQQDYRKRPNASDVIYQCEISLSALDSERNTKK